MRKKKFIRCMQSLKASDFIIGKFNENVVCISVVIDYRKCPLFKHRLLAFSKTFLIPYRERHILSEEYVDWKKRGLLHSLKHKLRWMLDHFMLWIPYCFLAMFKGYVEGSKWEIGYQPSGVNYSLYVTEGKKEVI